jgi:hypothetical protein
VALGQPERDVRRAQAHVDAELVADHLDRVERDAHGLRVGADGHRQRIEHDVLRRDAVVAAAGHDLARDHEPLLGGLGDAGLVVREADHGGAVPGDHRQDQLEADRPRRSPS